MKFNEVFTRRAIISSIPLMLDGRELSDDMQAKVMIMRVAYDKEVNTFEEDMKEILKGLKKEGFDDRSQAIQKMEDVDARKKAAENWKEGDVDSEGKAVEKPAMPSEDELKEAEKTRETKEEYDTEIKELNEKYIKARAKKADEESTMKDRRFTEDEYASIIGLITSKGDISIKWMNGEDIKVPREEFLGMVAAWLVDA